MPLTASLSEFGIIGLLVWNIVDNRLLRATIKDFREDLRAFMKKIAKD